VPALNVRNGNSCLVTILNRKFFQPQFLNRRRFVTGVAAGLGLAATSARANDNEINSAPVLPGSNFDLSLGYREVNFTGSPRQATVVNGGLPGPVLRWREGDEVVLRVKNNLAVDSSVHWHGLILPPAMDGVPGISFDGIRPGETFTYRFPVQQNGTYWYHSHSGFQEQTGLYGALVIDPLDAEPFSFDRDHVVLLSDWSDEQPERIFANLRKQGHFYNTNPRTLGDLTNDLQRDGLRETWSRRAMWNGMRMNDRDISDVTGMTYTFLVNGHTPDANWTGLFKRGEKVRLRFINAAAMTLFDVRIPGLKMTVVAADGQYVEPVTVDEFRIGTAETYDVIVEPQEGAYTLFAQAIDRSGYARGTLSEQPGLGAEVPSMDEKPVLTHLDMGMMHVGEDHIAGNADGGMQGMDMAGMDHARHDAHGGQAGAQKPAPAGFGSALPIAHHATEYGYNVDMRADMAQRRINDPGLGLRHNGRRVLTYADLRNLQQTADRRDPDREIQLHLTGNMQRYLWSIDGVPFSEAAPLQMTLGERLRITLVNDTMMNHPIHLHGMWSELETDDVDHIPRKHTVLVQPGAQISYLVTPEIPGPWAYHCHLLYHMTGMFRRVEVSG
jgi:CopA family copper-resistance protein